MIGAGSPANPSSSNGKHLTNEGRRQPRGLGGAEQQLDGHKKEPVRAGSIFPAANGVGLWAGPRVFVLWIWGREAEGKVCLFCF